MSLKKSIVKNLGNNLNIIFGNIIEEFYYDIEEIRVRVNNPIIIHKKNKELTVTNNSKIESNINLGYRPTQDDINKTIEIMSGYSIYAFEEEIKSGYLTLQGGHRIGLTGRVSTMNGNIITIKNLNGINIRLSHEVLGCSNKIIKYIGIPEVKHTMIISPPAYGKTTLLRDIVRNFSNGIEDLLEGQTVGVVDERSEIAGSYLGIPQNNVGIRTDVLDGCPKELGMRILLRSMSPRIIAVDEIGSNKDIYAIEEVINSGVKIICTVHGKNIDDVKSKPVLKELLEKRVFQRFIVLGYEKKPGEVLGIYDEDYKSIYKNNFRSEFL